MLAPRRRGRLTSEWKGALVASEAERHQALLVPPLPKREFLMLAHARPKSA